jgi:hypothetical protein
VQARWAASNVEIVFVDFYAEVALALAEIAPREGRRRDLHAGHDASRGLAHKGRRRAARPCRSREPVGVFGTSIMKRDKS